MRSTSYFFKPKYPFFSRRWWSIGHYNFLFFDGVFFWWPKERRSPTTAEEVFFGIKDIHAINLNEFFQLDEYIRKYYLLTRWRTLHDVGCLSLPKCKILLGAQLPFYYHSRASKYSLRAKAPRSIEPLCKRALISLARFNSLSEHGLGKITIPLPYSFDQLH